MITTPTASIPTKSRPMPTSSLRRDRRWTRLIPATMTAADTAAPTVRSKPRTTPRAMPGRTPWARASPMKVRPRSTTQVPTRAVMTATRTPASSARCMKGWEKGSVSQSMGER